MKKNLSVVLIIFLSGCISTFTLKDFESESIKVDNSIDSTIYKIILRSHKELPVFSLTLIYFLLPVSTVYC